MGHSLFMLHYPNSLTPFYDWSLFRENLDQTKKGGQLASFDFIDYCWCLGQYFLYLIRSLLELHR